MELKPSETFFTIPVRMYEPTDEDESPAGERDYILHKAQQKTRRYIVGVIDIPIEEIRIVAETFSKYDDFDIVIAEGCDSTIITLKDGEEIFCHWSRKRFREEYDQHVKKLQKDMKENDFQIIEVNDNNIKDFEKMIRDYKKHKKLNPTQPNEQR